MRGLILSIPKPPGGPCLPWRWERMWDPDAESSEHPNPFLASLQAGFPPIRGGKGAGRGWGP